ESGPRWWLALAALLLLWLSHPLTWGLTGAPLWSPPAGLGLALVAWFGWRFGAGLLAACGGLLLIHTVLRLLMGQGAPPLAWVIGVAGLDVAGPLLAWWLYHVQARGSRRLIDPRSATQFVLLVPGVAAVVVALARTALALAVDLPGDSFAQRLLLFWMEQALG